MENPDYKYVAIRDIAYQGTPAYRDGDLVHEAAVEGPDAWLVVGEDVAPRGGAVLSLPKQNASQATWAAYAISKGHSPAEAADMSRGDLIALYAAEVAAAPDDSAAVSDAADDDDG